MGTIGYLGLGSNVGDREGHLRAGIAGLRRHGIDVHAISGVYETEPVGEITDQPEFLNACVFASSELDPEELLDVCKEIEVERGRELGGPHHGPRPLDVDLLLLGNVADVYLEMQTERLTLPHPEITSRRFVLVPLLELDADLELPDGRRLEDCLEQLGSRQAVRPYGDL